MWACIRRHLRGYRRRLEGPRGRAELNSRAAGPLALEFLSCPACTPFQPAYCLHNALTMMAFQPHSGRTHMS